MREQNEAAVHRQYTLSQDAARKRMSKLNETAEERQRRLARDAARKRTRRENETAEERQHRLAQDAAQQRFRRENETADERQHRLAREAARKRMKRENETPGERQRRLAHDAAQQRLRKIMGARARGILGPIPGWLEIRSLTERSLRAAVTGLGIEILGALCARADPAWVRVQLCSLAAQKFTYIMYAELCQYMELCCSGLGLERTVVPVYGSDTEETGGLRVLQIKVEYHSSVGSEIEERDPEDDEL